MSRCRDLIWLYNGHELFVVCCCMLLFIVVFAVIAVVVAAVVVAIDQLYYLHIVYRILRSLIQIEPNNGRPAQQKPEQQR